MDTAVLTIGLFVIGTIITIIGYFLRTTYNNIVRDVGELQNDSRRHVEEQGKLKGKIELLEQEHRLKYQLIEETTQHEIRTMANKIGELSDTVGELIRIQLNAGGSTRRRNNNNTN
jgi:chromosome segregation ATPase